MPPPLASAAAPNHRGPSAPTKAYMERNMRDFDRHFSDITKMHRRMRPLILIFGAVKLGVIGFVLWLAWKLVVHFTA